MWSRQYFWGGLVICCLGMGCTERSGPEQPPNIVFVLADDLGIGDVGAYNPDGKIPTPHLDRLAAEGIRFTDAHTSSSVCTPTRYGILTGRYNWRSRLKQGVLWGKSKALIPRNRTTLAGMLQSAGYHTAFIGKWHLGWDWRMDSAEVIDFSAPIENSPNDLGFDYAFGHVASLDMPPYVFVENERATRIPRDSTGNTSEYGWWRKGLTAPDFIHEEVTPECFERSFEYIKKRAATGEPFFLYLPLPSPHTPILPTAEWRGKSGLNPYGDFVMLIDDYMGKLNATLQAAGIAENTMVIFTSDNGCSPQANFALLAEKGHHPSHIYRGHKADLFEGGHRVPYLVKWPDGIPAGQVSDQTICTTDLMSTCANLVGHELKEDEAEDSYDLLPLLNGQHGNEPIREATVHHSITGEFAIRQGQWKLLLSAGSGGWSWPRPSDRRALDTLPAYQLYDLAADPGETTNRVTEEPDRAAAMLALLRKYIDTGRSTPGPSRSNDPIDFEWTQIEFAALD